MHGLAKLILILNIYFTLHRAGRFCLDAAPFPKMGQISSAKDPCLDENDTPRKPQLGPWPPEGCHLATCVFIGIIMVRQCPKDGSECGPGQYLKLNPDAGSKDDCCMCAPVAG